MTSYLPHSDDVNKLLLILRHFVPEYHHAKFGGNWTTNKGKTEQKNKGKTERATMPPYILPKYPSLNRVKKKHNARKAF